MAPVQAGRRCAVSLLVLVISAAVFLRVAVSLNSYSGEEEETLGSMSPGDEPILSMHAFLCDRRRPLQVQGNLQCLETMRHRDTGWKSPTAYQ